MDTQNMHAAAHRSRTPQRITDRHKWQEHKSHNHLDVPTEQRSRKPQQVLNSKAFYFCICYTSEGLSKIKVKFQLNWAAFIFSKSKGKVKCQLDFTAKALL